jgi:hypothetical protein
VLRPPGSGTATIKKFYSRGAKRKDGGRPRNSFMTLYHKKKILRTEEYGLEIHHLGRLDTVVSPVYGLTEAARMRDVTNQSAVSVLRP